MRFPAGKTYIEPPSGWAETNEKLRKIKVETAKTLVQKMMDLTTGSSIFADVQTTSAKVKATSVPL